MEEKKSTKVVIGFDITDEYAQLSYFFLDQRMPETLKAGKNGLYNIPVCLLKMYGANQWFFGEQAVQYEQEGKGVLVKNLLSELKEQENITIDSMTVSTKELFLLFVKKCFSRLNLLLNGCEVEVIMVTVDELTENFANLLEELGECLSYLGAKVYIQSHAESLFYYILNQEAELWNHAVSVFEFSSKKLQSFHFTLNHKSEPKIGVIKKGIYEKFVKKDEEFLAFLEDFTKEKLISSVYLIGSGFEGEWYQKSLSFLCRTRRVFGGNNLYSKGACFAAKEKRYPGEITKQYLFLGADKLKYNIGVHALCKEGECLYPLLDAGGNWYEAHTEMDFLLEEGNTIEFVVTSLYGKIIKRHEMLLEGLTKRPSKTTRLWLAAEMESDEKFVITVTDLGFGNFFMASGQQWKDEIFI